MFFGKDQGYSAAESDGVARWVTVKRTAAGRAQATQRTGAGKDQNPARSLQSHPYTQKSFGCCHGLQSQAMEQTDPVCRKRLIGNRQQPG